MHLDIFSRFFSHIITQVSLHYNAFLIYNRYSVITEPENPKHDSFHQSLRPDDTFFFVCLIIIDLSRKTGTEGNGKG